MVGYQVVHIFPRLALPPLRLHHHCLARVQRKHHREQWQLRLPRDWLQSRRVQRKVFPRCPLLLLDIDDLDPMSALAALRLCDLNHHRRRFQWAFSKSSTPAIRTFLVPRLRLVVGLYLSLLLQSLHSPDRLLMLQRRNLDPTLMQTLRYLHLLSLLLARLHKRRCYPLPLLCPRCHFPTHFGPIRLLLRLSLLPMEAWQCLRVSAWMEPS